MTACGYTPNQIDEMTIHDIKSLFSYWREYPPLHEILTIAFGLAQKTDRAVSKNESDPSGIGGLIARHPDGFVRLREP